MADRDNAIRRLLSKKSDPVGDVQESYGEAIRDQSLVNSQQGKGYQVDAKPKSMPDIMPETMDKVLKRKGR